MADDPESNRQSAWASPYASAALAGATVLQQAEEQGDFRLPKGLRNVVSAITFAGNPPRVAPTRAANAAGLAPPSRPGPFARVAMWVRENKAMAAVAGIALGAGVWWLLRRKA